MIYTDKCNRRIFDEHTNFQQYIWYRKNRHLSDYFTFETADLISPTGKKITSKSRPYINIGAGFDCETSRFNDSEISFVYIWQFSVGKLNFLCRDYNELSRFMSELSNLVLQIHGNATILIGDANINYEFSYFKKIFFENITKAFCKDKSHVCTFTIYNNLKFIEVLGVMGRNLATIAKNYNTVPKRKGDLDYDKIRNTHTHLDRKEILYCVNDVAILAQAIPALHKEYTLQGDNIPMTQTGIVRNAIKKAYCPNSAKKKNLMDAVNLLKGTEQEYKYFRRYLYSGGLTHSNFTYVGKTSHNVQCFDLTSAYPWALNAKTFPAGELIKTNDYRLALSHKHWIMEVTFHNLKSKSSHSTLSLHKCIKIQNEVTDNGRIYSAEYVKVLISEVDYQNIKAIYDFDGKGTQITNMWYFTKSARCPQPMLDVMNGWYIKKAILKPHSKDTPENEKDYLRLKQLINSIYGMLVTALYDTSIEIGDDDFNEVADDWENYSNTIFNMYIGYWCTAYVRQRLIQCISKYPNSILQYDTDSIYCLESDTELKAYVEEINGDIAKEIMKNCKESQLWDLGQWDDDGHYIDFMALGSKRYIGRKANGKIKITFAGASDTDIISEAKRTTTDIFDFIKDFNITQDMSTKTGAKHFKGIYSNDVTDYKGNTVYETSYGSTTVINVPFTAHLSKQFANLADSYNKAYAVI